jgi:hypothetical protein
VLVKEKNWKMRDHALCILPSDTCSILQTIAIPLILHDPHLVLIMFSNLKNRSIQGYPNESIISGVSKFFQILAIHLNPSKFMLTYINQNLKPFWNRSNQRMKRRSFHPDDFWDMHPESASINHLKNLRYVWRMPSSE